MITDGETTYAVYTYNCGSLQWGGSFFFFARVGYNAFGTADNYPFSGTPTVADQISCRCQDPPWFNIIYELPKPAVPTTVQSNRVQCIKHYINDVLSFPPLDFFGFFLPPCPCSGFQAWLDRLYWRASFFLGLSYSTCFVQRFTFGGPTRLCCYNGFFG